MRLMIMTPDICQWAIVHMPPAYMQQRAAELGLEERATGCLQSSEDGITWWPTLHCMRRARGGYRLRAGIRKKIFL